MAPEASGTDVMGGIIGSGAERVNPQVRFVRRTSGLRPDSAYRAVGG